MRLPAPAYVAALPLAALALPLLPWLARGARARGRRLGLLALTPRLARALAVLVPWMLADAAGGLAPARVVAHVDRWLALLPPHARRRLLRQLTLVELAPLLRGMPPVSRLRPDEARALVQGPLDARRGLWGDLARVRQLLRLAWYADPAAQRAVGFVAPEARAPQAGRARTAGRRALEPHGVVS